MWHHLIESWKSYLISVLLEWTPVSVDSTHSLLWTLMKSCTPPTCCNRISFNQPLLSRECCPTKIKHGNLPKKSPTEKNSGRTSTFLRCWRDWKRPKIPGRGSQTSSIQLCRRHLCMRPMVSLRVKERYREITRVDQSCLPDVRGRSLKEKKRNENLEPSNLIIPWCGPRLTHHRPRQCSRRRPRGPPLRFHRPLRFPLVIVVTYLFRQALEKKNRNKGRKLINQRVFFFFFPHCPRWCGRSRGIGWVPSSSTSMSVPCWQWIWTIQKVGVDLDASQKVTMYGEFPL